MTLIKSISGIRGTIGGKPSDNLTPFDIVIFVSAFASWLKSNSEIDHPKVAVGRDARISGQMVHSIVNQTLVGYGVEIFDLGLSTTPTVKMAVVKLNANAGIMITASHNSKEWNALKFLDSNGEILNAKSVSKIINIADNRDFSYSTIDYLGKITIVEGMVESHVNSILELSLVNRDLIKKSKFKVVLDAVNSTGGIAIPILLDRLGVETVCLYCDPNGNFPHNPEPLEEHLSELSISVVKQSADFGIAVDPDVDRLAFVDEKGDYFGEEYTLVACSDYVLSQTKGNSVSNLSSTKALYDITKVHGGEYFSSAVGELNVIEKMKEKNAVIGGEGNGGVIYPDLHYGRDALVGIALFLSFLAHKKLKVSSLRASYPNYFMSNTKVNLPARTDSNKIIDKIENKYKGENLIKIDGLKIEFENSWVHVRKSNTEPIIRIYTEAASQKAAKKLASKFSGVIKTLI